MSYSITIGGHTRNPHNEQVKAIAEEAWAKVKALHDADETPPSLSGWSGDDTGTITLTTPQPAATPGGIEQEPTGDEKATEESGTG